MSNIVDLEKLFHRSKDRIRDLGEVFTPDSYVEEMIELVAKDKRGLFSDEEISFFEPCAGHGNIVLPIYRRRLDAIYRKISSQGLKSSEAAWYAVANALNTLWAIDIDPKNVENCRSRVLSETFKFLKDKLEIKNDYDLISKKRKFFAHLISAIKWHIHENETLSALSNAANAKAAAHLTKSGAKWLSKNSYSPMNFDLTWVTFYASCENTKTIPMEFERSLRFIDVTLTGKVKGYEDFEFAKSVISINKVQDVSRKSNRSLSVGA